MPRVTWTQNNFNGGEWSPLAHGRVDIQKYKSALDTCLNYIPTAQGGLTRRPGTRFIAEVKDSTKQVRLQRFEFSISQAYVLEFGPGYIRFYTNDGQLLSGGVPYEVATPYTEADLFQLNFAQSADVLYIAHPNYAPRKLRRLGATNWQLSTISFLDGPYLSVNTTATTLTPSGTTGVVTVTASAATFAATDVGRALRIKCGGVWLWGLITAYTDSTHVSWTITAPTGAQVPTTATGTANVSGGSVFSITVTNGGGGYGAQPPSVFISGGGGSGAVAYANLTNGVVTSVTVSVTGTGYGSPPGVAFSAPTAIAPSSTTFWRLGLWGTANGYPTAVTFHQDRLYWAGCTGYPGRLDGSNSSDYENFAPTNLDGTVVDSNAVAFNLNSNTVSAIYWMASDEWGMLVGTAGGEWVVSPSNQQQALTPTNVNAKQMSSYGCANIQPARVAKAALFVQRTKRKLREFKFQYLNNTFQAQDVSLLGEHLTKGGLKQIAVTLAPQQVVWMVRTDGLLAGMCYDPDQEILGWHQHQIGGWYDADKTVGAKVESAAAIPAPAVDRDELWLVVNRNIGGVQKRYVEVSTKLWEDGDSVADAAFVDSSAAYSGAPVTTITGLTWLVGQTVSVLADGSAHPECVVAGDGSVTLNRPASVAQVGLGYTSRGRTLRIEAGGAEGSAQGKLKRIHRLIFRFFQSIGLTLDAAYSASSDNIEPFRSSADAMDAPVALYTGDKDWRHDGTWDTDGRVSFSQTDPLPSNITMLSVMLETQDGG